MTMTMAIIIIIIIIIMIIVITKGYGVLATKMECQNAFKPTECINCET